MKTVVTFFDAVTGLLVDQSIKNELISIRYLG